ncbi:MAG: hypothetical protein OHK0046_12980 [Anaerolineae bacterium]
MLTQSSQQILPWLVREGLPDVVIVSAAILTEDHVMLCQHFQVVDVPVVMLLMHGEDLENAFHAGASLCLTYPLNLPLLRAQIRQQWEMRDLRRALQRSEERFRAVSEMPSQYLYDLAIDDDQQLLLDNATAGLFAITGYSPEELYVDGWRAIVHPDDLPGLEQRYRGLLQGQLDMREFRIITKSGSIRWLRDFVKPMWSETEQRVYRAYGIGRDITTDKATELALQASEERHRIISETISDYAYSYIVQADGTLKKDWSTQAFHDITGFTFMEMDENGWEMLIHPEDRPLGVRRFENLLAGKVDVTEFRIVTKSGQIRWLRDHGHPVVDEKTGRVVHIYGAAQDITERKRYEEELEHHARELQERNEELDAFAYTVAHDLKNPISSMMGFASLIQSYYDRMPDDQILEYLDLIMEGGYKLKSIINALLLLSGVNKIEQAEVEPLDMRQIVEDSKKRLVIMIDELRAKIIVPEEWPVAAGYAPWVEEIWMNYLSNALKYGGRPPQIELGAEQRNDMVVFWVRDNGRGLTSEEQKRVFTPFTRLNQVKIEGHGLGLSVVQRIVQKLGGTVSVESKVGEGSIFSFTLPVYQ